MSIFDFFDDMKEKSAKRKQAEEYRRSAKKYVADGERIYNKAYSEVTAYSNETSYKIDQHYSYKQRIIKELGSDVKPVLSRFNSFDIDKRIFDAPSIDTSSLGALSGMSLMQGFSSSKPLLQIPSIFDLFGDPEEEYWEARRQRDQAKWFYEDMKYERQKLNTIKDNMRTIRNYIYDEKQILENLVLKVKNITSQLKSSMMKTSFSQLEADYLKGIHKIALSISELLTTRFLNDDFTITSQYKSTFERIKEINNAIATAPTISEGSDGVRRLIEIIAGTIRT